MAIKDYRDLLVWQKSMLLAKEIYLFSADFPKHEIYGLSSQIRRSAVSVPSNIARVMVAKQLRNLHDFCALREAHFLSYKHKYIYQMI